MNKEKYITQSTLLDRGWTKKMIDVFYPTPDLIKAHPLQCFSMPLPIEAEPLFRDLYKESIQRKSAANKAVETKRKRLMEYIKTLGITLPDWKPEKAFKEAVNHYNNLWAYRGKDKYILDYKHLDMDTLERITANMFRHRFTKYEEELDRCFGKVGSTEAHDYLRTKINEMVHQKYFADNPIP